MMTSRIGIRQRSGFTLVELMVVIAILVMVASLLMPALKSARDRSKTVRCASSLRQIGAGFFGYLNDHNGYFPYMWAERGWNPNDPLNAGLVTWWPIYNQYYCPGQLTGTGGGPAWSNVIKPYLGGSPASILSLMQCKANPWPWSNSPSWNFGWGGSPVSGYSLNNMMFPANFRCATFGGITQCALTPPTYADYATPATPRGWDKRVNLSDVEHPASVALLGEMPVNQRNYDNLYGNLYGLPNYWGISACSVTSGPGCTASYGINLEWRYPYCNGYIATLHNFGMNALIVDGHVDWISKAKLFDYSSQVIGTGVGFVPNGTPGGLFWTDGKGLLSQGVGWYAHQFPGGPWPE